MSRLPTTCVLFLEMLIFLSVAERLSLPEGSIEADQADSRACIPEGRQDCQPWRVCHPERARPRRSQSSIVSCVFPAVNLLYLILLGEVYCQAARCFPQACRRDDLGCRPQNWRACRLR